VCIHLTGRKDWTTDPPVWLMPHTLNNRSLACLRAVWTLMPNRSTRPIAAMTCLGALLCLPTSVICLHCYYIQSAISRLIIWCQDFDSKGDKWVVFAKFVSKYDVFFELNLQWRPRPTDCRFLGNNVVMHISSWVVNKTLFYFIYLFI